MSISTLLFLGGIGASEILLLLIFLMLPAVLWIWAIVDLLRSTFSSETNKLIWALVIVFIPFIGSILYLVIGRNQKVQQQR
jgi:glucan phosphoethanolaminetransferase (alkaline phosphatase superfamily)